MLLVRSRKVIELNFNPIFKIQILRLIEHRMPLHACFEKARPFVHRMMDNDALINVKIDILRDHILMFVGKARRLPQNGAPERCFTLVGITMAPGGQRCKL
jgi:hypothetical protein